MRTRPDRMAIRNRVRGVLILALQAVLALALLSLDEVGRETPWVDLLEGADGSRIIFIRPRREGGDGLLEPSVRLVVSRLPVAVDPVRSVARFADGSGVVLPLDWPAALIDAGGVLRRHPLELEAVQAEALVAAGFDRAREGLLTLDPTLRAFWGR